VPSEPQLVLLSTSHRVAPGLLTAAAWDLVRSALLFAGEPGPHVRSVLQEQDIAVGIIAGAPAQIARELLALADSSDRPVVWLVGDDGDPALIAALAPALASRAADGPPPTIEVLPGSYDLPGARLLDLVAVMDRLRSPGGCPWDAEQTHQSLAPYLLEEAHETLEAIETAQRAGLIEELGDLLLQVVFHARLGEEDGDRSWSIDDVAAGIVTKLVNRHPHVFGDVDAPDAQYVADNWERIKAAEKGRTSVLDGIPTGLPALARAAKVVSRADRAGLHVDLVGVDLPDGTTAEEVGGLLLGIAAAAQRLGIDPETALRESARGLSGQVRAQES
jgi:XTP/dITP diphosphohydrolase